MNIQLSPQAEKFLRRTHLDDQLIETAIRRFIAFLNGEQVNLNVKRMRGVWRNYYRLRLGHLRLVVEPRLEQGEFYVERLQFRGKGYK